MTEDTCKLWHQVKREVKKLKIDRELSKEETKEINMEEVELKQGSFQKITVETPEVTQEASEIEKTQEGDSVVEDLDKEEGEIDDLEGGEPTAAQQPIKETYDDDSARGSANLSEYSSKKLAESFAKY